MLRGGFVYSISLRKPSPSTSCASLMKRNASSSASRTMGLEPSHLLRAQDAQQHRAFLSAVAALGTEHRYPPVQLLHNFLLHPLMLGGDDVAGLFAGEGPTITTSISLLEAYREANA